MQPVIIVDFSGTLIRKEAIEEANLFRSKVLDKALPTEHEHAHNQELYLNNQEAVQKLTGIRAEYDILYTMVNGRQTRLSGEDLQNMISTTLFSIGMYQVTNEMKEDIFVKDMIDTLRELRTRGYALAIMSGVRTDIISAVLDITETADLFDYVLGQPPQLGISNQEIIQAVSEGASVTCVIGDKLSDIKPAKEFGVQAIFADWGHATGGEQEIAEYTIQKPQQLLEIIK